MKAFTLQILVAGLAVALGGCASHGTHVTPEDDVSAGVGPWHSLVDLREWRGYRMQAVPAGWSVEDGALRKETVAEDLISREVYGDFDLEFEWRLSSGGNSGIFYRATEEYEHIYWSGPEYQLLDDARHPDGRNPLTSAAAAYGLYPPPRGVVHAAGEWNHSRIIARGPHVEHWLNGQKVVEYELGSADWRARVAKSKFGEWPNYGRAPRGHIGIQGDHNGALAIRAMRIRTLP